MVIFLPYLVWYQIFREFCEPISTPLTEGGIKWSTTLLHIDYGALSSLFAIFSLHNSTHVSLRTTKEIVF